MTRVTTAAPRWQAASDGYDEAFEAPARARGHYRPVLGILRGFSRQEIARRERLQQLALLNHGITFTVYGEKEGIGSSPSTSCPASSPRPSGGISRPGWSSA